MPVSQNNATNLYGMIATSISWRLNYRKTLGISARCIASFLKECDRSHNPIEPTTSFAWDKARLWEDCRIHLQTKANPSKSQPIDSPQPFNKGTQSFEATGGYKIARTGYLHLRQLTNLVNFYKVPPGAELHMGIGSNAVNA